VIRVLVVDDSAFARKVVREILTAAEGIEVVGIARDGLDALEKIAELKPDVVTLDLVMPHLDGLGVLRSLGAIDDGPRVLVVSMVDEESELGVEALSLGAFDVVHKPTALAVASLYDVGEQVIAKVRAAYRGRVIRTSIPIPEPPVPVFARTSDRLVVLGTSTGGPQALTRIVRALPADFPAPLAIALHIPPGYTEALARRLNDECALQVVEASDGLVLRRGLVVVARAGMHMKLARFDGVDTVRVDVRPMEPLYRPSVDVLFESAAKVWGAQTLGVVLTGMGDDGTRGSRMIREAGGNIITEAESTCVVFGMPRSVKEAGLSDEEAPLDGIVAAILRRL
jgi:two-component system, chemotaxis family, protein-glutamate methylesterase/glutaminase